MRKFLPLNGPGALASRRRSPITLSLAVETSALPGQRVSVPRLKARISVAGILALLAALLSVAASAEPQTNSAPARELVVQDASGLTNDAAALAVRRDAIRNECIRGRRIICGRVIKILPDGLVVDSGYTKLLQAPYNQSWLVSSGALVPRDPKTLERNEPGAVCIGPVFLSHYPKRPAVKLYDYVILQVYPVGPHTYTSVPGVEKTIRNFSAGLDTAIQMQLAAGEK